MANVLLSSQKAGPLLICMRRNSKGRLCGKADAPAPGGPELQLRLWKGRAFAQDKEDGQWSGQRS